MEGFTWANIENDLLFLLAEKVVGVTSFIRFSAVCKSWHSIASATKCYKLVPWLMLIEKEGSDMRDFYDHSTREVYQFYLPEARGVKYLGFAHGWLITCSEDVSFNLLDPLTGTRVSLPPLSALQEQMRAYPLTTVRDKFTIKAVCFPIGPDGEGVVVLKYKTDGLCSCFCRPTDKDWTVVNRFGIAEVAFVCETFYTVTSSGEIHSFVLTSSPELIEIAELPCEYFYNQNYLFCASYIVECAGEILVVLKMFTNLEDLSLVDFKVFKLDVKGKKFVGVKSIGDYALFLGNNSFSIDTSLYGNFFRKNCLYCCPFVAFAGREVVENLSVFDLENGRVTTFPVGKSEPFYSFPLWVLLDPFKKNSIDASKGNVFFRC